MILCTPQLLCSVREYAKEHSTQYTPQPLGLLLRSSRIWRHICTPAKDISISRCSVHKPIIVKIPEALQTHPFPLMLLSFDFLQHHAQLSIRRPSFERHFNALIMSMVSVKKTHLHTHHTIMNTLSFISHIFSKSYTQPQIIHTQALETKSFLNNASKLFPTTQKS